MNPKLLIPFWGKLGASLMACLLHIVASGPIVLVSTGALMGADVALNKTVGKLPLYFIENKGQANEEVALYTQGKETTIYFTASGLTFLQKRQGDTNGETDESRPLRWAVKLDFEGANQSVVPVGRRRTPAVVSYFRGSSSDWKTGVSTFSEIVYQDLWPGIDLVFSGTVDQVKHEFVVHPGANPADIRLTYRGADVSLGEEGEIVVETPLGAFTDDRPYVYQDSDVGRQEVECSYNLDRGDGNDGVSYSFDLGTYDGARDLVIDPVFFVYSGFIGGSSSEEAHGIAIDGAGSAYVTGFTHSDEASFPVVAGPDLTFNNQFPPNDAFVAKVRADGTGLVYCGYIGGYSHDGANAIAVDALGNAYVAGSTMSGVNPSGGYPGFPVKVGPDLTPNGLADAFVAKVNASGTDLVYCGYIGGWASENAFGIAVDSFGAAYVTGVTPSDQNPSGNRTGFPVKVGPDTTFNGSSPADPNGFVAKVNPGGGSLAYCGYIGGGAWGRAIAVDDNGYAYVTGFATNSTLFPVTVGPDLTFNGHTDAFVTKVDRTGASLVYSGFIGGSGVDDGMGIAVDTSGNAYVTGETTSRETSFPVLIGPDLSHNGGSTDVFVTKVLSNGSGLGYSGYIGGLGGETGKGIAVDPRGRAYVTGLTHSDETSFPVRRGPDLTFNSTNSAADAFIAKLTKDGTELAYAGYIGGANTDEGNAIAVDSIGRAFVAGRTRSDQSSFPTVRGPDLTYNTDPQFPSAYDAFVTKIVHLFPPIQGISTPRQNGTNAVEITFVDEPATDQTVEYKDSLEDSEWRELKSSVEISPDGTAIARDIGPGAARYYRVRWGVSFYDG